MVDEVSSIRPRMPRKERRKETERIKDLRCKDERSEESNEDVGRWTETFMPGWAPQETGIRHDQKTIEGLPLGRHLFWSAVAK